MDDTYFKRKAFDDFLKKSQNVGSFDELGEAFETYPKALKSDELLGHMLMESAGAKEDDPRLLGKLRDMMYKDSDIAPAEIKVQSSTGSKDLAKKELGGYLPKEKTIIIQAEVNPLKKSGTYAHEVGHHMDQMVGKSAIPIHEFPEEKIAEFVKNNPKATDMDLKKFMDSVKNYGMDSEAVAKLAPAKAKELQVTMHHAGEPRGFEMSKVYDILKGAGKNAKKVGMGITKIGAKAIGPVGIISGLASGDASAAIPGMWSEEVGKGSDEVPQMNKEEMTRFNSLKERLESEE
jgi:hypothetical protein